MIVRKKLKSGTIFPTLKSQARCDIFKAQIETARLLENHGGWEKNMHIQTLLSGKGGIVQNSILSCYNVLLLETDLECFELGMH